MIPNSVLEDYWFVMAEIGAVRKEREDLPDPVAMRKTLLEAVKRKPQVMVKITSFSKREKLKLHIDYISRQGTNEVFDETGMSINGIADTLSLPVRAALMQYGEEIANAALVGSENAVGRTRSRVSMNMVLSMPPGTDTGAFELSVGEFLSDRFSNYDYLFTFHDDTEHYHSHAVICLQGYDGEWLNPKKHDLLSWRKGFAESLERHGIPAIALPAYSRGNRKESYRRDLNELEKKGERLTPIKSPAYDAEIEASAIEARANAWERLAKYFRRSGDFNVEKAISGFVADHYDRPGKEVERER